MLSCRFYHFVPLLLLLLALPAQAEKTLARPPGTTRYGPMVARLQALLAYHKTQGTGRMTLSTLGHSVRGRELWMVTLHETLPVPALDTSLAAEKPAPDGTVPSSPADLSPPKRLFYLCRQHGHEPASTEAALEFITQMVRAAAGSPLALDLQRVTVYVVPMANPDGAEAFLRHNAHDKDINRDWLRRTQPETQALYRALVRLRPDMMTDQHELYPDDPRPDFTETAGEGSGASATLVQTCDSAQSVVQTAMQAAGCPTVSHLVTDRHPARLAHRFGCIVAQVPTLLFETNRLTRLHRNVPVRAQAHLQFMIALLRDTAGERNALLAEAAAHASPQSRNLSLLASRHMSAPRAVPARPSSSPPPPASATPASPELGAGSLSPALPAKDNE